MLCMLQEVIFILLVSHEVFEPSSHYYMLKKDSDIHEGFTDPN
jgi:hypothetical protein